MDANHGLYECDRFGVVCRQVYRSGDYAWDEPIDAALLVDASTGELAVQTREHGVITTYSTE